ncbi:hypothetical protein N7450_002293 [Penicillium hetheringtonii]|uniref:Uncharacterized protein n=1 Tax=Penicillium hetheringtonii TaxID=911720 RepID=A0AAD6DW85_9EURO|nr:hypothetical protein N7450_002293 [Penicillium hetheringtonii]
MTVSNLFVQQRNYTIYFVPHYTRAAVPKFSICIEQLLYQLLILIGQQYLLNNMINLKYTFQNNITIIQYIIDKNSIQSENIYNFDETGFAIDLISVQKIVI